MPRRACLAIGVSTLLPPPEGPVGFADLDGAIVAAETIGAWAKAAQFGKENVQVVVDRLGDGTVTEQRVQAAIDALFPADAEPVSHLLLSFCGHGLTGEEVNSLFWLFGNSLADGYRVNVSTFIEQILRFGVQRLTLISDACREGPPSYNLLRLEARRAITGRGSKIISPMFDHFAACQDGEKGFMVGDQASALPGKCIFSGVVADVLWGQEPDAVVNNTLTTGKFFVTARARATQRADDYKLDLHPQCWADPETTVLFGPTVPLVGNPQLQPWPPIAAVMPMGPAGLSGEDLDLSPLVEIEGTAQENVKRLNTDSDFRNAVLGKKFGTPAQATGQMGEAVPVLPDSTEALIQQIIGLREIMQGEDDEIKVWAGIEIDRRVRKAKSVAVEFTREQKVQSVADALDGITLAQPEKEGSQLLVSGQKVAAIWSDPVLSKSDLAGDGLQRPFQLSLNALSEKPVMIEFKNGLFAPAVPYTGLHLMVMRSADGACLQGYGDDYNVDAFRRAMASIADFTSGKIGPEHLDQLAGELRDQKHIDPVLGVISAYLYRAIADFDNIRRMAYYYCEMGQPVPFDIALLGAMPVKSDSNGALRLEVPEVKERKQSPGAEPRPYFTLAATPQRTGKIGGLCPWLSIGWDYVGEFDDSTAPLLDGLAAYAKNVSRKAFTLLPKNDGLALCDIWGLKRSA